MFSPLRNRFGIPGVISVIALVFALAGGAYAADSGDGATASANKKNRKGKQGGLNAKQKRQVRNISANIAKRFQGTGPIGPQGLPGLPGAPGEDGDDGDDGSNGDDGADGKSVALNAIAEGEVGCESRGGVEVEVEGSGSPTEVCNGQEGPKGDKGDPWTAGGTLPKGATLTGSWAVGGQFTTFEDNEENEVFIGHVLTSPISFPIPLAVPLPVSNVIYVPQEKSICEGKSEPEKAECLTELEENCPGTAAEPDAAEGHVCVYRTFNQATAPLPGSSGVNVHSVAGGQMTLIPTGSEAYAFGTWAVTGT